METLTLTLPFQVKDVFPVLDRAGIQYSFVGDMSRTILGFAALKDFPSPHEATWSRNAPESTTQRWTADYGLVVQPKGATHHRNALMVEDPHRAFFRILREVYPEDPEPTVRVGAHCYISPFAVIGGPGFGHVRTGPVPWRVPHIGGVIIEDYVDVGSYTCIDRGCLGHTIIRKGAKIDNLVHIAHNVEVGEGAHIVAGAVIGGSATIGAGAWIGINASVRDGVTVGENAVVGMHSNVVKNVPPGVTVMGNPAREK